ncbi:Hypothetical protein NTJ_06670 [Nesidiocoris tenuis]|uniref:Uncharacterized protein n=1 Tax=Nesidiocoris tenuis TaxID=355587 RepID=A0ABN7ANQ9_9HEMI|nr:Hypothetical protein NTJ_06670 [Nesidiocoris tenuis]
MLPSPKSADRPPPPQGPRSTLEQLGQLGPRGRQLGLCVDSRRDDIAFVVSFVVVRYETLRARIAGGRLCRYLRPVVENMCQ